MTNKDIKNLAQAFNSKDVDNIKNNGVVFTPLNIAKKIIKQSNIKITDKVCEPSVGRGIFVFTLIDNLLEQYTVEEVADFTNNNLYCFDINIEFIIDLKQLIQKYFNNLDYKRELKLDNIRCEDYLNTQDIYDVIIGNPPYIKIQNINKEKLSLLKSELDTLSLGNVDIYYAFVEKALKEADNINFIIPNSFIKNKSGKFLRDKLKNRIISIEDFKTTKIWDNISTYTCIISCRNTNDDNFIYNDNKIENPNLDDKIWSFSNTNNGSNKLNDLINFSSIGIQTSADKIFLLNEFDDNYAYINGYKIELGICKKIIKATTTREFNEHIYIIYPYDKENIPLEENTIKEKYPMCYEYLLSNKDSLSKRNLNHNVWYAYGRNQGLLREKVDECIILPLVFLKSRNIHYIKVPKNEESLILKGILVDTNDLEKLISVIQSERFLLYLEENNKILPDKKGSTDVWLSITANSLKNYLYE